MKLRIRKSTKRAEVLEAKRQTICSIPATGKEVESRSRPQDPVPRCSLFALAVVELCNSPALSSFPDAGLDYTDLVSEHGHCDSR